MKLFSTLALVAAVATAQDGGQQQQQTPAPAPRAASPDAGMPVAAATPAPLDAGSPVAKAPAAPPDGGAAAAASPKVVTVVAQPETTAELQRVQAELQEQNAKLDTAVRELDALRTEVTEQRQQEQAQRERREAQHAAGVTLGDVDQQLLTGDTNVTQALSSIEETLGPTGRANLQLAREALANSDLTGARYYLSRAANDAQAGR